METSQQYTVRDNEYYARQVIEALDREPNETEKFYAIKALFMMAATKQEIDNFVEGIILTAMAVDEMVQELKKQNNEIREALNVQH